MNNNQLADAIGVHRATIGNWRRGEVAAPDHDKVRAVSLALNVDVKDAYLAAGILRPGDLDVHTVRPPLSELTNEELADEVRARLLRPQASEPAPGLGKVHHLRPSGPEGWRQNEHDLAALRHPDAPDADQQGLDDDHE
ncbi:hypothetical protein AXK57_20750 [Tsukamurella pulmonis]|nr:hypothetical protein AXK57_20750 [Tsukamurella pulmonis]